MAVIIETEPKITTLRRVLDYSEFTAVNQSVSLVFPIRSICRIVGIDVWKAVTFDAGTVQFGHGTTSGLRNTYATAGEVAATASGTSRCEAWRATINDLLATGDRPMYARFEGASLPTRGSIHLWVHVIYMSPRGTM